MIFLKDHDSASVDLSERIIPKPGDFWKRGDEIWYIFQDRKTKDIMMMKNNGVERPVDIYMIDGVFGWKRTYSSKEGVCNNSASDDLDFEQRMLCSATK